MQREKAMRLASAVTQTDGELVPYRQQIAVALMSLLPDDVSAFAASPSSTAPGVWAISEGSLYQVLVNTYEREPGQNPPAQITCGRRPLDPGGAIVSVRERLAGRGQATVRQRRWEFILAAGEEAIVVETEQTMRGGFPDERRPSAQEELARALARALGFGIPSEDAGQPEY